MDNIVENKNYLTQQIITYLGNKRALLQNIAVEIERIQSQLDNRRLICLDLFSGSGIVARLMKQYSQQVIANDLEYYSKILNDCYLSNKSEFDLSEYRTYLKELNDKQVSDPKRGIITNNYSAKDENNILKTDRLFYTQENAIRIDTYRHFIEYVPAHLQKYFLAQLIVEASVHVNTSGVFKGFYKNKFTGIGQFGGAAGNALSRIKGKIELTEPILSNFESDYVVYQKDAEVLANEVHDLDITYLDPPYNQHPYGSNYFMLNVIARNNIEHEISKVSGIPKNWNRSQFNNYKSAYASLENIIRTIDSKYIIISYNNEGFIPFEQMIGMLSKYGDVSCQQIRYNTFRGSRNLSSRDLYTNEYLFTLKRM